MIIKTIIMVLLTAAVWAAFSHFAFSYEWTWKLPEKLEWLEEALPVFLGVIGTALAIASLVMVLVTAAVLVKSISV